MMQRSSTHLTSPMNYSTVSDCSVLIDWMDVDWKMLTMMSNSTASRWKSQYVFSGIFSVCLSLLAVLTLFQSKSTLACRMNRHQIRSVTCYFYTLEILIALMGLSRFIIHTINYATDGKLLLPAVEAVLSGMIQPCLTSGFCLLFIVLLQSAMRVRQLGCMSRSCLSIKVILGMCVVHFGVNISGQLLVKFSVKKGLVMRVCYLFFVVWGAFLFLVFPLVGCYVRRGVKGLHRMSMSGVLDRNRQVANTRHAASLQYKRLIILTSCSSVAGLSLCFLYTFAVVQMSVCTLGSESSWWWFALTTRLVEFTMAILLLFSTVKTGKEGLQMHICCKLAAGDQDVGIDRKNGRDELHEMQEVQTDVVLDIETPWPDGTTDDTSIFDSGVITLDQSTDNSSERRSSVAMDSLASTQTGYFVTGEILEAGISIDNMEKTHGRLTTAAEESQAIALAGQCETCTTLIITSSSRKVSVCYSV